MYSSTARAREPHRNGAVRSSRSQLDEEAVAVDDQAVALLEIDDALNRLAETDPRLARVFECRFYGGLTEEEIAEALGRHGSHRGTRLGEGADATPRTRSRHDRRGYRQELNRRRLSHDRWKTLEPIIDAAIEMPAEQRRGVSS
jgi:hypothetical protein